MRRLRVCMSQSEPAPEITESVQEFIQNTTQISQDSTLNERFYKIQAINQDGGMNVEIVNINISLEYISKAKVHKRMASWATRTISRKPVDTVSELDLIEDMPEVTEDVSYVCTVPVPSVTIHFKTPYGKIYEQTCNQIKPEKSNLKEFLQHIHQSLMENDMTTVDEVTPTNTINAEVKIDKDVSTGDLFFSDSRLGLNAEKVEEIDATSSESILNAYLSDDTYPGNWKQGYITDVRELSDENIVGIVIQTPLDKTVVPFKLNYNEDNSLWTLIEQNGGTLQDLKDVEVCVRERYEYLEDFPTKLTLLEQDMPEISNLAKSLSDYRKAQTIKESETIETIGIDVNYVWDVGIPTEKETEEETESGSIIARLL